MFNPKKAIPTLAVGVLALAGCGGDSNGGAAGSGGSSGSGGTSGTGGSTGDLQSALNSWCMKLVDCFPGYYAGVQDCVNYISEYYGIIGNLSPACEAAAASYFDCGSMLSCAELDMFSNDCDDEFDAASEACT